jgi:hypothetical protein
MSPYITPPSKRGVTTHEDRQEVARSALVKGIESKMAADNPNTQQTPEYTKDKYNVKIMKRKVSPKVSPTTYVGQRVKGRRSERGEGIITQ